MKNRKTKCLNWSQKEITKKAQSHIKGGVGNGGVVNIAIGEDSSAG